MLNLWAQLEFRKISNVYRFKRCILQLTLVITYQSNNILDILNGESLADQGGIVGARPPEASRFFRFYILIVRGISASDPGAPLQEILNPPLRVFWFLSALLPPAYAVEVMFSSCLCVCVSVCLCVCLGYNFWTSWHRNFIFGMVLHLDHI